MIGLPYGSFMKQVIEEIIVQNKLYQLQKYWDIPKPHCKLLEGGESLGLEKLISAFIIAFIGTSIALIIFIMEKILHSNQPGMNNYFSKQKADSKKLQEFFKQMADEIQKNNFNFNLGEVESVRSGKRQPRAELEYNIEAQNLEG